MMLQNPTFWVAVAFAIFILAFGRKVFGILAVTLDDRADRIRQEIEAAQTLREDAQAALAQYQRRQRDALKEAEHILAAARDEAQRLRQAAAADLEVALKRREAQAMDKIAQAEAQALRQVQDMAVELAVAAAGKLLVDNLDAARDKTLIDRAIGELPSKLH